jgi:hypothetical protein
MKRSNLLVAAVAVFATLVAASTALGGNDRHNILYRYVGQVQSTGDSSVTVAVQNGNRAALRSMIGQSQVQTFVTGDRTVFIRWADGKPTKVGIGDLQTNDYVTVNVRAERKADLATVTSTPAAAVADRGQKPSRPTKPLYLFRGTLVSATDGKVTIAVKGGNRHALRLMVGQSAEQAFSTGPETVFLHWAKRIPTVIDAGGLKVGDRIVVRVRADRGSTLAEVEATAAKRIADREPKSQETHQNAQA